MVASLYTKLDSGRRQIHLVELKPGRRDQAIECRLMIVSLRNQPSFEALSYFWGPSEKGRSIKLDDRSKDVTDNLYNALCRLRNDVTPRILWIDQLCINQSDNDEKSQQVPMMGAIYTQSSQTLLWLGDEPDETASDVPADQLRVLRTRPSVWALATNPSETVPTGTFVPHLGNDDWGQGCAAYEEDYVYHAFSLVSKLAVLRSSKDLPYLGQQPTLLENNTLRALWFIMHRPWWGRIWTIQECLLPKKAIVMYGPVVAPFEMFFLAASRYRSLAASGSGFLERLDQSQAATMRHFSQSLTDLKVYYDQQHASQKLDLTSLLRRFRIRDATNDRDKVYGLLGLNIEWKGREPLVPNYDLSTAQVYQATALALIESTESLDIMMSNLDRTGSKMKQMKHVPTIADVPELPPLDGLDLSKPEGIDQLEHFMNQFKKAPYFDDTPNHPELPSWVPDWSSQTNFEILPRYDQMQLYAAAGGTRAQARLVDKSILCLSGVEVDIIRWSSQIMAHNGGVSRSNLLRDWKTFANDASVYTSIMGTDSAQDFKGEFEADAAELDTSTSLSRQPAPLPSSALEDAFWRTLCGNTVTVQDFEGKDARASYNRASDSDYQLYLTWCREIEAGLLPNDLAATGSPCNERDGAAVHMVRSIEPAIRAATTMRRLFITRKGFLGLGPALAVGGEKIFLLHGGKAPFLARAEELRVVGGEGEKQCYRLVGDCYIHGIMDGEAMSWGCPESDVFLV